MEFKAQTSPNGVEVQLIGRLEFTDHERIRDVTALIGTNDAKNFTVDLGELKFIDSAGLGMLLILQEEAESRGVRLIFRRPQGDVRRSIELARLNEVVAFDFSAS